MKRPNFAFPHMDMRSVDVQVVIELIAGGLLTAVLLRWFM